jgi:hypothetical protein
MAYQSCPCPARSPWGAIQTKRELAPGIWSVSTAGHGGIKLSRERNAAVPQYMRSDGGWYEEDCEWAIAAVVHPIGFQRHLPTNDDPFRCEMDIANSTLKHWYPDHYEKFFNCKLKPGEFRAKDGANWREKTVDSFVVAAAWGSWANWVPQGKTGVVARRERDKAEKWLLVDADLYAKRAGFGLVIDFGRDQEVAKPERTA